jgi:hypothetical protein
MIEDRISVEHVGAAQAVGQEMRDLPKKLVDSILADHEPSGR